jgi:hypothetical protein
MVRPFSSHELLMTPVTSQTNGADLRNRPADRSLTAGATALRRTTAEALQRNTPRASSVAFLLRRQERPTLLALDLSGHPLAQSIDVRPHGPGDLR